jgi:hypothetical protein
MVKLFSVFVKETVEDARDLLHQDAGLQSVSYTASLLGIKLFQIPIYYRAIVIFRVSMILPFTTKV